MQDQSAEIDSGSSRIPPDGSTPRFFLPLAAWTCRISVTEVTDREQLFPSGTLKASLVEKPAFHTESVPLGRRLIAFD